MVKFKHEDSNTSLSVWDNGFINLISYTLIIGGILSLRVEVDHTRFYMSFGTPGISMIPDLPCQYKHHAQDFQIPLEFGH